MALNFYVTAIFVTILFYFIYVKLQELPMNLIFSSENVLVFYLVKSSPNWFLASVTVGFSSCVSSCFLDAAVVNEFAGPGRDGGSYFLTGPGPESQITIHSTIVNSEA